VSKWLIDEDHASVTFAVRHFMIANVVGLLGKMTGIIYFDPPDISRLSAEAVIDVSSMSTGNKVRDGHLLGPDFLDSAKHPGIAFKTTKVEALGINRGRVTADLAIRGITRPVSFEVECLGPVKSPFSGKSCIGFRGATRINRRDYGIRADHPMEGGGFVVGEEVEITFDLEADFAE
jgi:polyisoprenoid-binding protein YceI